MSQLPQPLYSDFQQKYPDIWQALPTTSLQGRSRQAGPFDGKEPGFVASALAIGGQRERAAHAHVRKLVELGVSAEEIRQRFWRFHSGLSDYDGRL